jgi:acetyl/propionyl-CoA carboxylase alpha subunit
VRVDSGIEQGTDVTVHYDPLLAKLIVGDDNRDHAIRRAEAALRRFPILGVRTNLPFLIRTLRHPRFLAGDVDTGFIAAEREALWRAPDRRSAMAAAVACAVADTGALFTREAPRADRNTDDPWVTLEGWR